MIATDGNNLSSNRT